MYLCVKGIKLSSFHNFSIGLWNSLWIVVCPVVSFLLTVVLSPLLRFTASDYLFGIFKLFLNIVLDSSLCVSSEDKRVINAFL
jgi:hypothetical protein